MRRMKKAISLLLAAMMVFGCAFAFSACAKKEAGEYKLVLITDGAPVNDKGYNQSAWDGVKAYGDKNNLTYRYYQPAKDENGVLTAEEVAKYVELAAKNGAEYIVFPGEAFAAAAYEVAPSYGDVKFILLDAFPHAQGDSTPRFQSNVMCVSFDKQQAGFLAGYTAVTDGYKKSNGEVVREYNTKLGFLGSAYSDASSLYGAGFVQGAARAADDNGVPVKLEYAEYDSPSLDYDYSFTIRPVYIPREEAKDETFRVTVVDGLGSGVYTDGENVTITANPAPEGKVFDHWEVKSDTEGVKDKKVNISHKKKPTMNLLVGDCDCTITAVWADAETVPVTVTEADGITANTVYNVTPDSSAWVTAPAAASGKVFDHWETNNADAVENINARSTNVSVGTEAIVMQPVYADSAAPTFDVTVENGTGSGAYLADDEITVTANPPEDGYMFYKWENVDALGLSTGIAMDNEYKYSATFKMVDRYASIVEKMFDEGTQIVFGGGNPVSDSVFNATWAFDYPVFAYGWGYDESGKGNCFASVVNDYGAAVKLCLEDYQAGGVLSGNCANRCLYVTGKSLNKYQLDSEGEYKRDKEGNLLEDAAYSEAYQTVYDGLADGSLTLKTFIPGTNVHGIVNSNCLSIHTWVKNAEE